MEIKDINKTSPQLKDLRIVLERIDASSLTRAVIEKENAEVTSPSPLGGNKTGDGEDEGSCAKAICIPNTKEKGKERLAHVGRRKVKEEFILYEDDGNQDYVSANQQVNDVNQLTVKEEPEGEPAAFEMKDEEEDCDIKPFEAIFFNEREEIVSSDRNDFDPLAIEEEDGIGNAVGFMIKEESNVSDPLPIKKEDGIANAVGFEIKDEVNAVDQLEVKKDPKGDPAAFKTKDEEIESSFGGKGSDGLGVGPSKTPRRADCGGRKFLCEDCGKLFSQAHHLRRHVRTHTGERPFKCELCGCAFTINSHRLRHLRLHLGVRRHRCVECGKEFFEHNHLLRHYRRHRNERPWRCNQCEKAFCEASGLKKHMQTHSSERPYKCQYCGRGFLQPSELSRHTVTHTGIKMFKCDVCEKAYARKYSLNNHKRTHLKDGAGSERSSSARRNASSQGLWTGFQLGP